MAELEEEAIQPTVEKAVPAEDVNLTSDTVSASSVSDDLNEEKRGSASDDNSQSGVKFYKAGMIDVLYGKDWIRKFCVVNDTCVRIISKSPIAAVSQRQLTPKKKLPTTGAMAVDEQSIMLSLVSNLSVAIRKDGGKSFFMLSMMDGTTHCFAAGSVAEMAPWVELLRMALDQANSEPKRKNSDASSLFSESSSSSSSSSVSSSSSEQIVDVIALNDDDKKEEENKDDDDNKDKKEKEEEKEKDEEKDEEKEKEKDDDDDDDDDDDKDKKEGGRKKDLTVNVVVPMFHSRSPSIFTQSPGESGSSTPDSKTPVLPPRALPSFMNLVCMIKVDNVRDLQLRAKPRTLEEFVTDCSDNDHLNGEPCSDRIIPAEEELPFVNVSLSDHSMPSPYATIHFAARYNAAACLDLLLNLQESNEPAAQIYPVSPVTPVEPKPPVVDLIDHSPLGWTALHHACAAGSLICVKTLLIHGARTDIKDKFIANDSDPGTTVEGRTPVILALQRGKKDVVALLLKGRKLNQWPPNTAMLLGMDNDDEEEEEEEDDDDVDVIADDIKDEESAKKNEGQFTYGLTNLHMTAAIGNGNDVRDILEEADMDDNTHKLLLAKDVAGQTALHYAANVGNVGTLVALLEFADSVVFSIGDKVTGMTALAHAAARGNHECVNELVQFQNEEEACASVAHIDRFHRTPLHHAVNSGNLDTVKAVMASQMAEKWLYSRDDTGRFAVEYACTLPFPDIAMYLVKLMQMMETKDGSRTKLRDMFLLHEAICADRAQFASMIIDTLGTDSVNVPDLDGLTPLHRCSTEGCLVLLLEHGAQPNVPAGESKWTPLHFACSLRSRASLVPHLIAGGADPTALTVEGKTPLFLAVEYRNSEAVQYLLKDPRVNVNSVVPSTGMTPLLAAMEVGDWNSATMLSDAGADFKAVDIRGENCLHKACSVKPPYSSLRCCELAVAKGVPVNEPDTTIHKHTPLHIAALNGNGEAVTCLVARSHSLMDQLNGDGFSPLHLSVLSNQERVMAILLRLGARADIQTRDDHFTPLLFAIRMCRLNLVRVLLFAAKINRKVPCEEPLADDTIAVLYTIMSIRSAYADKGLINLDDDDDPKGKTYIAILKFLLECGGKPVLLDKEKGTSALHELAEATELGQHNLEVLISILCGPPSQDSKMDLNVENRRHRTPMLDACRAKNHVVMRALLDRGVSVEHTNALGMSPVHESAWVGDLVGMRLLLDRGASMYRTTIDGVTALHCAAHAGNPDTIRLLITQYQQFYRAEMQSPTTPARLPTIQAFINARTSRGRTPLHVCCLPNASVAAAKAEECCRVLINAGADPCAVDEEKNTPLHCAALAGNLAVAQRLLLTPTAVLTANKKNKNRKYPYQLVTLSNPNGQHLQQILKDAIALAKRSKHGK